MRMIFPDDLHVWRVGKGAYAAALVVVTRDVSLTPARVKASLGIHAELVHLTVEIDRCA